MPKAFKFKDANKQLKFYKKLFSDMDFAERFPISCENDLLKQLKLLQTSGFFDELVEKGVNGGEFDFNQPKLMSFISNVYRLKEGTDYAKKCKEIHESMIKEMVPSMTALSDSSFILLWIFSSKAEKKAAEEAYNKLVNSRNSDLVLSAVHILETIDGLPKSSLETIKNDYSTNRIRYKQILKKMNPDVFTEGGNVKIFEEYIKEHETLIVELNEIGASIQQSKKEIKDSLERLLAEKLISSLKAIPVEELAKSKTGIKVKYLKDAGYHDLADIQLASGAQLASVYGISQDKAYTIKNVCNEYYKQILKVTKIKLSTDDKSKAATRVVKSIYVYAKKLEFSKRIDNLNAEYGDSLNQAFAKLKKIGNGVIWPFLSELEIGETRSAFEYVKKALSTNYEPSAKKVLQEFRKNKSNSDNAWDDFAVNSINYYNIIEEICPGLLGNGDSLYGLPEDLARQIQDECYFPDGLLCTLRKYQEWGVKYILHQEKVLLGDEMGLGKTIQAIATMVSLKNIGGTHFLVICPTSVVTNWCREIIKHSKLRVTKIHGTGKEAAFNSWLKTGGVAVTNYESIPYINLRENYKISLLVVDEAHYIKNPNARRSVNARLLASHSDRLLFMTGTALENRVDEMISLISVLRPSIADQIKHLAFMSSAPEFREKIAPVYYRRKREDVLTELPDKIESKEWCVLNPEEETIYEESILSKNFQKARRISWDVDDLNKSSKAQRLKEIVDEAEAEGRKILVFSYFLDTINKIHDFLDGKCLNPINGSINVNRRQEIIDEFDKAPAGTVLLAQINSGGTGLNIQSASVVVICEPQFKPSVENQAISRAYRMGQSRKVLVYRLLCENSIDEKLVDILEEKQQLFDAFADKSVAAEKTFEIDEKTFGDVIKEEIDRINKKRGIPSEASLDVPPKIENHDKPTDLKDFGYEPINVAKNGKEYYESIMKMSYDELVQFLINKYGPAKYDYYTNEYCTTKNKNVTRTKEGLYCHHIDEDKAIMLSNDAFARANPFEYQKANRLVYCNFLEHFLLHILIVEEPKKANANKKELQGIGGAVNFICKQLNDLYNGYEFKQGWMINTISIVKNDYESYIMMLKRLWNDIKNDELLSFMIKKEELAMGWDGRIYSKVLEELN